MTELWHSALMLLPSVSEWVSESVSKPVSDKLRKTAGITAINNNIQTYDNDKDDGDNDNDDDDNNSGYTDNNDVDIVGTDLKYFYILFWPFFCLPYMGF